MLDNLLSILIFGPLIAGLVLLLVPLKNAVARLAGAFVSIICALLGLILLVNFSGTAGVEFFATVPLIPSLGINYAVGVDGLSILVLMVAVLLMPMVFLLFQEQEQGYYANLLVVQGAMVGAIVARDILMFYIFWEVMLLPVFFMIGLYGGEQRVAATIKITIYTIAGSLLMFASIVYLAISYQSQTGVWSFALATLTTSQLAGSGGTIAFFGFMAGVAIKIPLLPFHTWLPDAYTEAPAGATFVLAAIMAKIGVYALIRFVVPIFEESFIRFALILACSGVIGMIYCGIAALAQKDFKRMLAFASASHMGLIALGVFCLNQQALTGTLLQIVAHATSTGLLFLLLGLIEEQLATRNIEDLGGLAYRAPLFSTCFAVAMLSSVGLPGTSGFIGEFLIILGAIKFNIFIGILAGTTLIIGVCYMLWLFQRVFFEKQNRRTEGFRDLSLLEAVTIVPAVLLIIFMGLYPQPFIDRITPAAEQYTTTRATRSPPVADQARDGTIVK